MSTIQMKMAAKPKVRQEIARLLEHLSESEKQKQSQFILSKLIEHPRYKQAKSVSIYLSTGNEINTEPILRRALEVDKKRCFVPLVLKKSIRGAADVRSATRMVMYELRSMAEYEQLPLNHYGIREPQQIENPSTRLGASLDLIITPGVAFELNGRRLGHGKGYYDEYLRHWTGKGDANHYSIGVAFREQILPEGELPFVEGRDFVLDQVLADHQ